MSMSFYNYLGLMLHGMLYTGVINHLNQKLLSKGSVDLIIPRIGRVIMIWD